MEAYDCLKAIYLERGYRSRDIPRLILENNLYGIDIDTRAAQLASFALLMKAREDDRRLFSNPPKLNIIALQDSQPERLDAFSQDLASTNIAQADLQELLDLFEHSSTFGSLIQVPEALAEKLPDLEKKLKTASESGDIFSQQSAQELLPLVQQAKLLGKQYDAVIANPPYMGGKGMNTELKDFAKKKFPDSKSDLFAMFIERGFVWCKDSGFNSMVTMQSWMFLSSYEAMREKLLQDRTIQTMAHLGARAFPEISGEVVQTTAFVMQGQHINGFKPVFFRLVDTAQDSKELELKAGLNRFDSTVQDDFKKIPGSPVAYWLSNNVYDLFESTLFGEHFEVKEGLGTRDDDIFLRRFWEVALYKIRFSKGQEKWIKTDKGGAFRKWFGNQEYVMNWESNGFAIKNHRNPDGSLKSRPQNSQFFFKKAISWNKVGSGITSFRLRDDTLGFNDAAPSIFGDELESTLSMLNSKLFEYLVKIQGGTLNVTTGIIKALPFLGLAESYSISKRAISIAQYDWNSYETSWDFTENPIIRTEQPNLEQAFNTWQQQNANAVAEMKHLEEENNKLFIDAYGLQDELTPVVPDEQITLTRADREKDSQRLVSYALGCMMGRYSLDEPGLIYAHAGNQDFDASRYQAFQADADGIIPLTEMHWFEDDATHRIREFLAAVWGKDTLEANMLWLAESLDKKANETAEDTIRRYLASKFYKDHMQTYKKRPIYWLFSSGKQGAFQALVYLHRYNESTLARMRTEYVMPLISKMSAMANSLESEIENSDSAAEIKRKEKELQNLHKQQAELSSFEEKLRHYADQRISLDLDDGVKVNYGKFGDLLAEVKAITGEK
ncbi:Eco57I restriction-modification methylase [Acinetobacter bohemicus]|uniref:site-specific DNA-methyltransferase (adenine-specific) n=1 Tax=Acinetobacter bohemicus TaxID=1435036 RepID=A0A1I6VPC8_9GAMM|nr:Eco57I restriction-modification methylase [Acinetobacter bohemicus]